MGGLTTDRLMRLAEKEREKETTLNEMAKIRKEKQQHQKKKVENGEKYVSRLRPS